MEDIEGKTLIFNGVLYSFAFLNNFNTAYVVLLFPLIKTYADSSSDKNF